MDAKFPDYMNGFVIFSIDSFMPFSKDSEINYKHSEIDFERLKNNELNGCCKCASFSKDK